MNNRAHGFSRGTLLISDTYPGSFVNRTRGLNPLFTKDGAIIQTGVDDIGECHLQCAYVLYVFF